MEVGLALNGTGDPTGPAFGLQTRPTEVLEEEVANIALELWHGDDRGGNAFGFLWTILFGKYATCCCGDASAMEEPFNVEVSLALLNICFIWVIAYSNIQKLGGTASTQEACSTLIVKAVFACMATCPSTVTTRFAAAQELPPLSGRSQGHHWVTSIPKDSNGSMGRRS